MISLASLSDPEARRREAYEAAKERNKQARQLSLVGWFEKHSQTELKFASGKHRCTWCPHCGHSKTGNRRVFITDDRHWECWICKNQGSIIDAEMIRYGDKDISAACCRLLGLAHESMAVGQPLPVRQVVDPEVVRARADAEAKKAAAVAAVVQIICKQTKHLRDESVMKYLTGTGPGERGFPRHVVEEAIERNLIRMLPSDGRLANAMIRAMIPEQTLRDAGLWKETSKAPWISYRPLWFIAPRASTAELRIARVARTDEPKSIKIGPNELPYYWEGKNPAGCALVEGFPDMLALVSLGYDGDILAMPGKNVFDEEWCVKLAAARGTKRFDTYYDNDADSPDNPGQSAAAKIGLAIQSRGLQWHNVLLPSGDVNDLWLNRLKQR